MLPDDYSIEECENPIFFFDLQNVDSFSLISDEIIVLADDTKQMFFLWDYLSNVRYSLGEKEAFVRRTIHYLH